MYCAVTFSPFVIWILNLLVFGFPISLVTLFQVSLLTENGNTKDDLRLPTDDTLLAQVSLSTVSVLGISVTLLPILCSGIQVFEMSNT